MAAGPIQERNQDATIYVGGLDEKVTEAVIWELFVQAGPVVSCHMPKDRISGAHQGYGFVEFLGEEDADYAIKIMNMIKLYGKPVRVNKASAHQKNLDVGANVFIGNLDSEVDEKLLYDTFSAFGVILQVPKIMRDPESGNSKGFAFVNFANFEASDASIEAMNGQYLCNRPISVTYAFKKDVKGERHGSAAERLLAAQNPLAYAAAPNQLFADAPPTTIATSSGPAPSGPPVPTAPPSFPPGPPSGPPSMHMPPGMGMPPGFPSGGPPSMPHPSAGPRMPPMQPPRPPQMPGPPPPPPGMMPPQSGGMQQQMGHPPNRPQYPPPPPVSQQGQQGGYGGGPQQPGGPSRMGGGPGPPPPPHRGPPMPPRPPLQQQPMHQQRGPPPPGYHPQQNYGGGPPRPPPPGYRPPMRGAPPPPGGYGGGMPPRPPPLPPQPPRSNN